jgi:hypothetical protein
MKYNAGSRVFNALCQLHELYSWGEESEVTVAIMRSSVTGAPL